MEKLILKRESQSHPPNGSTITNKQTDTQFDTLRKYIK